MQVITPIKLFPNMFPWIVYCVKQWRGICWLMWQRLSITSFKPERCKLRFPKEKCKLKYFTSTTTNPSSSFPSADEGLKNSCPLMRKQHQGVKYISLVSIVTMHGICFLASKPGAAETDSNSTATLWFTLVMMWRSSSSFPYLLIISHSDWMNQDPDIVFLHE